MMQQLVDEISEKITLIQGAPLEDNVPYNLDFIVEDIVDLLATFHTRMGNRNEKDLHRISFVKDDGPILRYEQVLTLFNYKLAIGNVIIKYRDLQHVLDDYKLIVIGIKDRLAASNRKLSEPENAGIALKIAALDTPLL